MLGGLGRAGKPFGMYQAILFKANLYPQPTTNRARYPQARNPE